MESIKSFVHFILHIDQGLNGLISQYGSQTYILLFCILFSETGLVVIPFLPGDSLLFAAGALSASANAPLNLWLLYIVLFSGALLGDNLNYFIGKKLGPQLFKNEDSKIFRKKHLDRTHEFFEKNGGKTIIMARFIPIVRTYAPFVAGLGAMAYRQFILFSIAGAAMWVGICVTAGYFFGQNPIVKQKFSLVVLMIVVISLVPAILEILKHRREMKASAGPQ
ncbi:MAG: DedA family protein [Chthonomonadales bacterium]